MIHLKASISQEEKDEFKRSTKVDFNSCKEVSKDEFYTFFGDMKNIATPSVVGEYPYIHLVKVHGTKTIAIAVNGVGHKKGILGNSNTMYFIVKWIIEN